MRQPFELFHRLVQQVVMLVFYTLFLSIPGILASPVYFLARWYAERQVSQTQPPHPLPNPPSCSSGGLVYHRMADGEPKPRVLRETVVERVCVRVCRRR